jgi:hypothetical protein
MTSGPTTGLRVPTLDRTRSTRPGSLCLPSVPQPVLRVQYFLCLFLIGLCFPFLSRAQTNGSSDLPASSLMPPRGEIPPTFWEQYGIWVLIGAALFLGLVTLGIWFAIRPKLVPAVPYSVHAREELESLRQQPQDAPLLSRTSQILRRCLAALFDLPSGELNTSEFCQAALGSAKLGPDLARDSIEFLKACDLHKFAPSHPDAPADAVGRALSMIDLAEKRLAVLARLESTRSTKVNGSPGSEVGLPPPLPPVPTGNIQPPS